MRQGCKRQPIPPKRESSAKPTEATTIEVDELDVVNRGLHQQAEFTEGN
jgi:hypothetical protein